ncbi:HTH domain-containing protein [Candidatus Absconditicoccus praedator]|uniref:HTH domain-containing protein n=1 Tax=Candidatus Absconditicoccus praedator TaxID=2735562 RepID=UPI001E349610|nr:HTH domain-containing protein [Candidatus Absconditicoccus praedator]UFX83047.1 hypothetical protein HLG78_02835 [Candidatus Absconditicoccus praedator]
MTFEVKMDDKKIKVDLSNTNIKDILQYCKPKEQLVLLRKYGLYDGKETPLQRIGNDYGLTRERVRQIESQGLMRFRRLIIGNERYLKVIEEAKKILDMNGGFLEESDLISKIINKGLFKFSTEELKLILVSDFDIYHLKRNRFIDNSFYIEPVFEDLLTEIAQYSISYFEKAGESEDMYDFIDKLKSKFSEKYDDVSYLSNNVFYVNFFKSVSQISVFDGKIGHSSFTEVNPKTIRQKIVYILRRVNKPLHYQELSTKIMEWFNGKPVKVSTVHNELVKNSSMFVNMGLGIYGLKEWGYEGGTVKDILERVMGKANRPMTIKEITKEVLKEKMISPNTIILTLQKYQDKFERVDKGTYVLKKI